MVRNVEPAAPSGEAKKERPPNRRHQLGPVEFTLLVIGAVVGADVYIVAGLGAGLLGPAQLIAR
jgi:hypothetical protein